MKTYKLNNLNEFTEAIDMGLDIEFFVYKIRYNISWAKKPFICVCPDGDAVFFESREDLMTNYKIKGKSLKELWTEIDIYSM